MKRKGFKIRDWDDLLKFVLIVAIVIILVYSLVDFINWKEAIDIIKQQMSINGFSEEYFKNLTYNPFVKNTIYQVGIDGVGRFDEYKETRAIFIKINSRGHILWAEIDNNVGFITIYNYDEETHEPIYVEEGEVFVFVQPINYFLSDHYYCDAYVYVLFLTDQRYYYARKKIRLTWSCRQYWYGWSKGR